MILVIKTYYHNSSFMIQYKIKIESFSTANGDYNLKIKTKIKH